MNGNFLFLTDGTTIEFSSFSAKKKKELAEKDLFKKQYLIIAYNHFLQIAGGHMSHYRGQVVMQY